ncbi:MAG: hypothetical protein IJF17_00930 [Thermoguttaceae bacterium]|nr:hypothetical protein [Thermoguttaceae bacterium]
MSEEKDPTLLEQIQEAKKAVISGGVSGVSGAGISISYISPEVLDKMEQQEQARQASGPVVGRIVSTPYDNRW